MSDDVPSVDGSVAYDEQTETYRATFECGETAPSTAAVRALASACDKAPTDLTPLNESIDPDALNCYVGPQDPGQHGGDRAATFTHEDHEVAVKSCGIVKVRPRGSNGQLE